MAIPLPSQTELQSKLDYDPETGQLTWAYSRPGAIKGEAPGFMKKGDGVQITVDRTAYRAHRLIWKWMTGDDPPEYVDHVNRDPLDNRWVNLRLATPQQNMGNKRGHGKYLKGAYKASSGHTFQSKIKIDRKNVYLGTFATEEEAHQAYCDAAKRIHREFACVATKVSS